MGICIGGGRKSNFIRMRVDFWNKIFRLKKNCKIIIKKR